MKKIISLILSAIMIVTLFTACSKDTPDETFMSDLTVEEVTLLYGESFVRMDGETISVMFYDEHSYSDPDAIYWSFFNIQEFLLKDFGVDLTEVADEISFEYTLVEELNMSEVSNTTQMWAYLNDVDEDSIISETSVACIYEDEILITFYLGFATFDSNSRICSLTTDYDFG